MSERHQHIREKRYSQEKKTLFKLLGRSPCVWVHVQTKMQKLQAQTPHEHLRWYYNNECWCNSVQARCASTRSRSALHLLKRCPLKNCYCRRWVPSSNCRSNIAFDEGAQRSFITEHLAADLALPMHNREFVKLAAFEKNMDQGRYFEKQIQGAFL